MVKCVYVSFCDWVRRDWDHIIGNMRRRLGADRVVIHGPAFYVTADGSKLFGYKVEFLRR